MGFHHQFSLPLVAKMIILLKPSCGRDAVLVKSNATYQCNGLLNECRMGQDLEMEVDFLMDSNVIRILQTASNAPPVIKALDASSAVQISCRVNQICVSPGGERITCRNQFGCRGYYPVSDN